MAYYFNLQLKRINRHLEALGFNVVIAYILTALVFAGTSQLLFEKVKFAEYIYAVLALMVCYTLSEPNRNTYLQLLFHKKEYQLIRLIENGLLALPFFVLLLFQNQYTLAVIVFSGAIILSFFRFTVINRLIIPTPFYKKPFEFIVGFRKNYFLFIGYVALASIAIYVDNFNLAIFALVLSQLTCLNFYTKPEPLFYVWTHAFKASKFLNYKIQTATLQSLIISLPIGIALLFFYGQYWYIIGLIIILSIFYIMLMLLGKYAYYPAEVNLIQVLAVAFSIMFPPFLLISLSYFYMKAKQNLSLRVL